MLQNPNITRFRTLSGPAALGALMALALLTSPAAAQPTINGNMTVDPSTSDDRFEASGSVSFGAAINTEPVAPPMYVMPRTGPWLMGITGKSSGHYPSRAVNPQLCLAGEHEGIHAMEVTNELPEICTRTGLNIYKSPAPTFPVRGRESAWVRAFGSKAHPGQMPAHKDVYSLQAKLSSYVVNNNPLVNRATMIADPVDVQVRHLTDPKALPPGFRIGAAIGASRQNPLTNPGGSTVSFDSSSGKLSFTSGLIDVMDRQGGLSGGVDSAYADDALRGTTVTISDLTLMGQEPDGRYRFGGGSMVIEDPNGSASLSMSFDEFLVGDTSRIIALDTFALITQGDTVELLDTEASPTSSPWIAAFASDHISGDLTPPDYPERWIDLSFVTDTNLVDLTNGFTTDALAVPADVHVGGLGVPEPATLGLLALGGLMLRRRVRA